MGVLIGVERWQSPTRWDTAKNLYARTEEGKHQAPTFPGFSWRALDTD